jgi:hypothetical protein
MNDTLRNVEESTVKAYSRLLGVPCKAKAVFENPDVPDVINVTVTYVSPRTLEYVSVAFAVADNA